MKMTDIVGILLIVAGIIALSYKGFTYTEPEKVAEIGNVKVTADTEKRVSFPPILGGSCVVVGIVVLVAGRMYKK